MQKNIRNVFLILALLALTSAVSFQAGAKSSAEGSGNQAAGDLNLSMMWKVKDRLSELFLDKDQIKDEDLVQGAISGMVSALDDPYTVYLPPKENKSANEDLEQRLDPDTGKVIAYLDLYAIENPPRTRSILSLQ